MPLPRALALVSLLLFCAACSDEASAPSVAPETSHTTRPDPANAAPDSPPAAARYVGSDACQQCHASEFEAWRGSHHDLAMQEATPETLLGTFDGREHTSGAERVRFTSENGRAVVEVRERDTPPQRYLVAYAFGVDPIQQLLLPLPGGRLQAFTMAWDSRAAEAGGQRWFSLHGDESVATGDPLHWSGAGYRWNTRCAECHTTNLTKGWNAAERSYETRWSEIDVACEACHGPASQHLEWSRAPAVRASNGAKRGLVVDLATDPARRWVPDPVSGIARLAQQPGAASADDRELDSCAPCHSRRSRIALPQPGAPFLDAHRPALLDEGLYFADGQIDDEVFVWGSFVQSRMHAAGVRCSDCHDPHSLALRETQPTAAGGGADAGVCAKCHEPARFATPAHHHHAAASSGAQCVACHMPARTYMRIDARRDHSFRIPRPDLSSALGVPNACSTCHGDRPAQWASDELRAWRGGRAPDPHFASVLASARRGDADARVPLSSLAEAPGERPIVRATALALLERFPHPDVVPLLRRSARDREALVRWGAVLASQGLPAGERASAIAPLLGDPVRLVRSEAARVLAGAPLPSGQSAARDHLLGEFTNFLEMDGDHPAAHVGRALIELARGRPERAEAAYREALAIGDPFVPAWVNLADLLRALGRESEGLEVLREGLARVPDSAELHHALGLALVRAGRADEALHELERAAALAPENPRLGYVLGIALHSLGRSGDALAALERTRSAHPKSADLLWALATILRDVGRSSDALRTLDALLAVDPSNGQAAALRAQLRAGS